MRLSSLIFLFFSLSVASVKHVKIDYCLYALNPLVRIQEGDFSSVWNIEFLCPSSSACDKSAAKLCGNASLLSEYPQCTLKACWEQRNWEQGMSLRNSRILYTLHKTRRFLPCSGEMKLGKAQANTRLHRFTDKELHNQLTQHATLFLCKRPCISQMVSSYTSPKYYQGFLWRALSHFSSFFLKVQLHASEWKNGFCQQ